MDFRRRGGGAVFFARLVLERMQKQLSQMMAAHVKAEEHLSKVAVNEASVEKVVRDTPM